MSVEKTINGITKQYLYDGLDIVQEIEGGAVSINYIRTLNIDEPLARITPNALRFYQTDALGSVIALTDNTGAVKTTYSYDPFGAVTITGEASDNPFQYTGRENNGTGLYYYRARYYSPELQRFISEDPIRLKGGDINFFSYVGNRPINFTDPLGLEVTGCDVACGLICGGGGTMYCAYVCATAGPYMPVCTALCWAGTSIFCIYGCDYWCHPPKPPKPPGPPRPPVDPYCPPGNDWCCN